MGRLAVLAVLATAWLLGAAGPVSAHPALVSSSPGAGYVVTYPPSRLVPVSALLAAPVGPAVRVAERVRQVSVSVVSSQGRVEIRADAPGGGTPVRIRLEGELAGPSGAARALDLDGCGPTCWTGPLDWRPGTNVLALRVEADRYDAGGLSIPVPLSAVPAPGLLRRVQDAMGAAPPSTRSRRSPPASVPCCRTGPGVPGRSSSPVSRGPKAPPPTRLSSSRTAVGRCCSPCPPSTTSSPCGSTGRTASLMSGSSRQTTSSPGSTATRD